jgi:hypothetical protein
MVKVEHVGDVEEPRIAGLEPIAHRGCEQGVLGGEGRKR